MGSYESFAGAYDALMADGQYRRRAEDLIRRFRQSSIPVHTVLDLGCGTGTVACLLAQRGYQVIASDGAEEMLTEAARKAEALPEGTRPFFLHQTMQRLRLADCVDAAVSTLDSLNYLTRERDLQETFCRVYRYLRPGGALIFDVNTPYKLRRMDGQLYTDETEDQFCTWRTFFSQRTQVCTYQVDLFHLRPDGAWERSYEEHRERAWSEAQLRSFLETAGFVDITFCGDLSRRPPKAEEDRWIVRAVRPAEER